MKVLPQKGFTFAVAPSLAWLPFPLPVLFGYSDVATSTEVSFRCTHDDLHHLWAYDPTLRNR